jgi:hypothetical protein
LSGGALTVISYEPASTGRARPPCSNTRRTVACTSSIMISSLLEAAAVLEEASSINVDHDAEWLEAG